jgi:predicted MFS family arabinose efflux permease
LILVGSALSGVALAACNPTTNKLISAYVARSHRGIVTGIKQSGVQMSAFIVGIAIPSLAGAIDWRWALAVTAVAPIATIAAAFVFLPHDPARASTAGVTGEEREPLGPTVRWMAVYSLLMGAGVAATTTYLPLYANEEVGMSAGAGGFLIAMIGLIGVASRIGWGWGADRLNRVAVPMAIMAIGAFVAMALMLAAPSAGPWVLYVSSVLFGLTAVSWNSIAMLAVIAEVETQDAGRASGYVLMGFYLGFVVSPVLFGHSVDETGSYVLGWGSLALLFLLSLVVTMSWSRAHRRSVAPTEPAS